MSPCRCLYCGALAENPTRLSWSLTDESGVHVGGALPLCLSCSALWCTHAEADEPVCARTDEVC
jgi:hypothetical protein